MSNHQVAQMTLMYCMPTVLEKFFKNTINKKCIYIRLCFAGSISN